LDPVVTLGKVQITPLSHLLVPAVLGFLAWGAVEQNGVQAADLGLTSTGAIGLALLLYVLLQAGRLVHEAGHVFVGLRTGRHLAAVRLTPLLMMAEWPPNELWHAPVRSRRLTAAAGSGGQMALGVALLVGAAMLANRWSPLVHEIVFLCGALHVAAVGNLLPVAHTDGHIFFGSAWNTRPPWLSLVACVLLAFPAPLAITAGQFEHGFVRAYLGSLITTDGLVPLVLAVLLLPILARRLLFPPS